MEIVEYGGYKNLVMYIVTKDNNLEITNGTYLIKIMLKSIDNERALTHAIFSEKTNTPEQEQQLIKMVLKDKLEEFYYQCLEVKAVIPKSKEEQKQIIFRTKKQQLQFIQKYCPNIFNLLDNTLCIKTFDSEANCLKEQGKNEVFHDCRNCLKDYIKEKNET